MSDHQSTPAELHHAAMEAIDDAMGLHEAALDSHDEADSHRRRGDEASKRAAWERAYELERRAAECFRDRPDFQPTRAVLYRGAAALAMRLGKAGECRELCRAGLDGAPSEIRREIEGMLGEIGT
jgi:hypothetical protein